MMKALIIGGSGFIGRNIIESLNKKKYYTISRFSNNPSLYYPMNVIFISSL